MVEIYGKSDRGNVRENNEDRICYPRPNTTSPTPPAGAGQLLLVADGVGGVQGGEHASRLTAEIVKRVYYYSDHAQDPRWLLRRAIETANQEVLTYTSATPALRGAASTVTAAVIKGNQLVVANVGDSRTYLIRADGRSQQISVDHSLTQQKINQNLLDPAQAKSDVDSHVITRSVGLESSVEVDVFPPSTVQPPYIPLAPGDAVLLCSDGLTDLVSDGEIARIVAANPPQKAVNQLIKLAKRNGGHDNISVIVGRVPGKGGAAIAGGIPGALAAFAANSRLWLMLAALAIVVVIGLALWRVLPNSVFLPAAQSTQLSGAFPTPTITLAALTPTTTANQPVVAALTAIPTDTQSALVKPTVTRIATQEASLTTPTQTPAATATRINASTQTPFPTANSVSIAQPELIAPEPNHNITGNVATTFQWKWSDTLTSNQGFEIVFWPRGHPEAKGGVHDARETRTLTPNQNGIYQVTVNVTDGREGDYEWTIAIVQLYPYQRLVEAPARPIKISSSGSGSNPDPGAAGPRQP